MLVRSLRISSLTTTLSAFAMIGAVACSSSSSGGGGGDSSSASGFIDSYCSYVASCCGAEGTPSDGSQCRTLLSLSGGAYDPAAGSACLDAVKKAAADDAGWCADQSSSDQAACNGAFKKTGQGSVAPGGKCGSDSDCAAAPAGDTVSCRHYFGENGAADADVCQVVVAGKAGDSCNGSTSTSTTGNATFTSYTNDGDATSPLSQITLCNDVDGLDCENAGDGYTCTALGAVGDDCHGGACALGTYCDYSTNKCAARLADGAACSASSSCVAGDFCDAASSVCKKKLKGGQACSTSDECESNDCPSGTCSAGSSLALAFLCGGSSN